MYYVTILIYYYYTTTLLDYYIFIIHCNILYGCIGIQKIFVIPVIFRFVPEAGAVPIGMKKNICKNLEKSRKYICGDV